MAQITCPVCGAQYEDTRKECPECGAEMPKNTRVCPFCGHQFGGDGPSQVSHVEL